MNTLGRANEQRLKNALERKFRHNGQIMTLAEIIEAGKYHKPHVYVRECTDRRVNLEYRRLATPRTYYELANDDGQMIEVPKLVYDLYGGH